MANALSLSERNGWARFISMQNHYNLVYREEEREMIPLCVEKGVGIIPWSPLARGRLARTTPSAVEGTTRADVDQYARDLYDSPSDLDVINANRKIASDLDVRRRMLRSRGCYRGPESRLPSSERQRSSISRAQSRPSA
jgi:aryl-alcohol dehydrogenase-like predicted oxidoreductase